MTTSISCSARSSTANSTRPRYLSAPRQLFSRAYAYGAGITLANYDMSKDGQRLLMVKDNSQGGRLRVILNWRSDADTAGPR